MSHYEKAIEDIRGYTFYLSSLADCMSPDSTESAGFEFLTSVRDDVLERLDEWSREARDNNLERWCQDCDIAYAVASEAPDYRTYFKWLQFADLGAWQEDFEGEYGDIRDMDDAASWALYEIARRLAEAIIGILAEAIEQDESESE